MTVSLYGGGDRVGNLGAEGVADLWNSSDLLEYLFEHYLPLHPPVTSPKIVIGCTHDVVLSLSAARTLRTSPLVVFVEA
jgi:hypothetical protein